MKYGERMRATVSNKRIPKSLLMIFSNLGSYQNLNTQHQQKGDEQPYPEATSPKTSLKPTNASLNLRNLWIDLPPQDVTLGLFHFWLSPTSSSLTVSLFIILNIDRDYPRFAE